VIDQLLRHLRGTADFRKHVVQEEVDALLSTGLDGIPDEYSHLGEDLNESALDLTR
jgi:hypothetical protein